MLSTGSSSVQPKEKENKERNQEGDNGDEEDVTASPRGGKKGKKEKNVVVRAEHGREVHINLIFRCWSFSCFR